MKMAVNPFPGDWRHTAGNDSKTFVLPEFFSDFMQNLHAYANAEKGSVCVDELHKGVAETSCLQFRHAVSKSAYTGKDNTVSEGNRFWVGAYCRFRAAKFKGTGYAAQVAYSIIHYNRT